MTWREATKLVALALLALWLGCAFASAAPPRGEEIEFRFEPSFRDGLLVWLARTPDGQIHCAAYRLPSIDDGGVESHSKIPPVLLKKAVVSATDFDALTAAFESKEVREAAEADEIGLDGTGWIFRRKAGGRRTELRFWTPERTPHAPAIALGKRFLALAQIEEVLLQRR